MVANDKIIELIENRIMRNRALILFQSLKFKKELSCLENYIFEIIKETILALITTDIKQFKKDNNTLQENQIKKRKNNLNADNKKLRKFLIINLINFIILNLFSPIKSKLPFNLFFYFQDSKITLKIKGISYSNIFGNDTGANFKSINYLREVYINGNIQEKIEYKYNFNQTENVVELIWNEGINDCSNMFSKCYNITEINLSHFDTSRVTTMKNMFSNCKSLNSLDLSNFNTSLVTDMNQMFSGCSVLNSLDLSSFNTKNVKYLNNMFEECSLLIFLDLSSFNTSQVTSMNSMFYYCSLLSSLDLSNFNTSQVTDMYYLFSDCTSLLSLNISNFNTSRITNMGYMFNYCSLLTSLDLSKFNTSLVTLMENMFCNCKSLNSLNLSNFETSLVTNMHSMFADCSILTSLDLSSFNTSKVEDIESMFSGCSFLTSLDLSNFNTSNVLYAGCLFDNCINLEYINLKNFDDKKIVQSETQNMFLNVPNNVVICINKTITSLKILSQLTNQKCPIIDCTDDWKLKQKKIINDTNECTESCNNGSKYKYEYNGKCYENCSFGFFYDENDKVNKCKCESEECLICPKITLNEKLCIKCNNDYYPKENDPLNVGEYIKCYKEPEGYYLDNNLYKQCYYTCKTCKIPGNNTIHNCVMCNDDYSFEVKNNNYINCYKKCKYYYYFDNENNYHCSINSSCPKEYSKLIEDKLECIKNDINNIIEDLKINEKNKTEKISKEEEIEYYDTLINTIEKGFTNNYDTTQLDEGKDEIIQTDKITITFTTSENQRNGINNDMTTIDLGECETLLRGEYNISFNETLYMKKMDIVQEGMKTTKVEYDVYCKLFGTNLIKLNLSVCSNSKISIYTPFEMNDNVDKYNSSSGYYNDICYTTTSEDGTDITLKDRQKNFINGDDIVCQEGCVFSKYDYGTSRALCFCDVKETPSSIANMNIDKSKLLDNFININNIVNFNFLVCYKNLFSKIGIKNNIGAYIIFAIILFHFISIIIFYLKQFRKLKKKITNIINIILEKVNKNQIKTVNDNTKKMMLTSNKKYNKIRKKLKTQKKPIKKLQIKKQTKKIMKLNDEEINSLPYNLAIIYDKRNYCEFYASLLITQHNFLSSFFNYNDYNSNIIKMDLFIIGFAIEYTVNGLFYTDDTMHKIYESKGEFDLETQLPIMLYSTLISMILNKPLENLALSNDAILNFKQSNIKINIKKKAKKLTNLLIIKFILFFIISFLFLVLFLYYISMFGAIYKNTQMHLLKDTLMSFGLSLIIPFGIYLFPGFFRIPALSNRKNKRKCLYNFSKFLQSF